MPTNEELQNQIYILKTELETLKILFYKDDYSNLEVFRKQVLFKNNIGFYGKDPIIQQATFTAPTGGVTQDAEARTAIGVIKTILTNLGLTT